MEKEALGRLRYKLAVRTHSGPKLTPEQRKELIDSFVSDPEITIADLARKYGIAHQSVAYLLKRAAR